MSVNLESQYDQIVGYIARYRTFLRDIGSRVSTLPFRAPLKYFRFVIQIPRMVRQVNPLSGKNLDLNRSLVTEYATEQEQKSEYYVVAVSDYPTDTMSDSLKLRFGDMDFEKLRKIHDQRKIRLARFSITQILGYIAAGFAAILKSVPKKVVEDWFQVEYEDFEIWLFVLMVVLLVYVVLFLLPQWVKIAIARRTHQYVGDILEYTAIKYSRSGGTEPPGTSGATEAGG